EQVPIVRGQRGEVLGRGACKPARVKRAEARNVLTAVPGEARAPGCTQPLLAARGEGVDLGSALSPGDDGGRLERIDREEDLAAAAHRAEAGQVGAPAGRELDRR